MYCTQYTGCINQTIQLVDNSSVVQENDGFVQYCLNGEWRTLCRGDMVWRAREAIVTCRQLGYEGRVKLVLIFGLLTSI